MSRYVVAGAPCSGKSSYVRAHARPGELIYDYDTLHQALSGQVAHQHDPTIRDYVLAARDAILADLAAHQKQPAWVITSTRNSAELSALRERLAAEVILLPVTPDEAHRRCTADDRPETWHDYIDNWFAETDIAAAEWPLPEIKSREDLMLKKLFTAPMTLKTDGAPGEFTAVFATLGVVDHDGDVTRPGAFEEGAPVRISYWGHRWGDLPVGKGVIHADEERAWVDGQFFMDTVAGVETYKTVKNLGELQEWSYGFDIEKSEPGKLGEMEVRFLDELIVHEVSPVMLGAGVGTHTVAIKSADAGEDDSEETPDEGQPGVTGEPSGAPPQVVRSGIEVLLLE